MTTTRSILRIVLAGAFAAAGLAHLVAPGPFLLIMPGWVPAPEAVVLWTGVAELLGAAGLIVPRSRKAAAWGLAAYTVCVFPANINHAWIDLTGPAGADGLSLPPAYHVPRLLFQPVTVWWCLFAGDVVDWPFRKASRKAPARARKARG